MSDTIQAARFLGNTDEVTSCDCCGKQNLKSTVAIETVEGGTVYFGVTCAARALAVSAKEVRAASRKADDDKQRAAEAARRAAQDAHFARWSAFLDSSVPHLKGRVLDQWQTFGSMAAARAAFNASPFAR